MKDLFGNEVLQIPGAGDKKDRIVENQLCPMCREKGSLKYKSYLMFSRVCKKDGTYVKLPTHPDYGK